MMGPHAWLRRAAKYASPVGLSMIVAAGTMQAQQAASAQTAPQLSLRAWIASSFPRTAISPDGRWFVAEDSFDGSLSIASADDGTVLRHWQPFTPEELAQAGFLRSPIDVSSDAMTILIARSGYPLTVPSVGRTPSYQVYGASRIFLIDAGSGLVKSHLDLNHFTLNIAAHPTQPLVACIDDHGAITILTLHDGSVLFSSRLASFDDSDIHQELRFTPDGVLLMAKTTRHITIWDWRKNKVVLDLDAEATHASNFDRAVPALDTHLPSSARLQHYENFREAMFNADGNQMIACSADEWHIFSVNSTSHVLRQTRHGTLDDGWVSTDIGCGFFGKHAYVAETDSTATKIVPGKPINRILMIETTTGEIKLVNDAVLQARFIPVPNTQHSLLGTELFDSETGDKIGHGDATVSSPARMGFDVADHHLLWGMMGGKWSLLAWDMSNGDVSASPKDHVPAAISADGNTLAFDTPDGDIIRDLSGKNPERMLSHAPFLGPEQQLSMDGSILLSHRTKNILDVTRVADAKVLLHLEQPDIFVASLDPGGRWVAITHTGSISIYDIAAQKQLSEIKASGPVSLITTFSPDGRWIALGDVAGVRLVSTADWSTEKQIPVLYPHCVTFSPDSKSIVFTGGSAGGGGVQLWDVAATKLRWKDPSGTPECTFTDVQGQFVFSHDGRWLATAPLSGVDLFAVQTGERKASLYAFSGDDGIDWLVATPDGHFDGTPGAWSKLLWRFNNNTFDVQPVETFFRDFYHPGLLADLIAGRAIAPPPHLESLDRRQPLVQLNATVKTGDPKTAEVTLEVSETPRDATHHTSSGVRELRLFRNGALVKAWHGEIEVNNGRATLYAEVPLANGNNHLTAYAFSHSNIKSVDAETWIANTAEAEKGVAYVLAIGENTYAADTRSHRLNLSYSESDALEFAQRFRAAQFKVAQFREVRVVELLSQSARREDIVAALRLLAGDAGVTLTPEQKTMFASLQKVGPNDGVFLFYAGHGYALDNHFYLLPSDFNPDAPPGSPLQHSISDDELETLLEGISPMASFLVIDACNSGEILEGGSLAQLAVEKGMPILAASQALEAAEEAPRFGGGHGLLTFALVNEGLKQRPAADDGQLRLRPWFDYAVRRVPEINLTAQRSRGNTVESATKSTGRQHPRAFYRRQTEDESFLVAKP